MRASAIMLFVLLLVPAVFAQDIGDILFRQILKMDYPVCCTGNPIEDLVKYLLVPTVFIILVLFTLVNRITDNVRIAFLLGVTFYLFIIVEGFYPFFAYLAGPYFLFLLFGIGIFVFLASHFGVRRGPSGGGGRPTGFRYPDMEAPDENRIRYFLRIGALNPVDKTELEHELSIVNSSLERIDRLAASGAKIDTGELHRLQKLKADVERKLYGRRLGK